jgi:hypothetical protein
MNEVYDATTGILDATTLDQLVDRESERRRRAAPQRYHI